MNSNMHLSAKDKSITVEITKKFKNIDISPPRLKRLVRTLCHQFGAARATVSIAVTDDAEIRRLNKKFLNHNQATDCLSFDLSDKQNRFRRSKVNTSRDAGLDGVRLFELVVNGAKAVREAKSRGHPPEAELALYITHGILHNFGFDDSTPAEAKKMHQTEDEMLQQFGYGAVYDSKRRKIQTGNLPPIGR
jgi:probable rRNA maturation factor